MADKSEISDSESVGDNEVVFDYIKAPTFQTMLADGAFGSYLPNGLVHFVLYSERPAAPERQVYSLNSTGGLDEEVKEKAIISGAIEREMFCDVVMRPDVAKNFAEWIMGMVKQQEEPETGARQ